MGCLLRGCVKMDVKDLPSIIEAFNNQEKLDQISYIIRCACEGSITHDRADVEIDKIIRSKNNDWKH